MAPTDKSAKIMGIVHIICGLLIIALSLLDALQ